MHASSQFTQGFAAQHSRSIFEGVSKILNQQNKKNRKRSSSSPTEEIVGSGFVPIFSHNSKNSEDSIRDGKMTTPVLENSSGGKKIHIHLLILIISCRAPTTGTLE